MATHKLETHRGMNLRDAVRLAKKLGCGVEKTRRNGGEWMFRHPAVDCPLKVNARRKDAPRSLIVFLKRVMESQK